jgi:branched-chain amino acid transport system substrate-binding protein
MGSVLQEPIMADIGDDVLGMIGSEHYVPLIENDLNTRFVSAYHKKYGEYPMTNSYGAWLAVTLFLEAVNATGGDTSHQKIIDALTKIKVDSPAGAYSLQREKNAFVGKGNLYIAKIVKIGDRYAWKPIHQYKDVLFNVP